MTTSKSSRDAIATRDEDRSANYPMSEYWHKRAQEAYLSIKALKGEERANRAKNDIWGLFGDHPTWRQAAEMLDQIKEDVFEKATLDELVAYRIWLQARNRRQEMARPKPKMAKK